MLRATVLVDDPQEQSKLTESKKLPASDLVTVHFAIKFSVSRMLLAVREA